MPAFICKQPNGKYCRFSTVVDTITHYNMTEEEYIDICVQRATEEARNVLKNHLRPFDDVKKQFIPNNDTVEEFNNLLLEMGDTEQIDPKRYNNN